MKSYTVDGKTIRKLRELRGWPGPHLAASANISHDALYRIERGETQPRLTTLRHIADALEVELRDLLVAEQAA